MRPPWFFGSAKTGIHNHTVWLNLIERRYWTLKKNLKNGVISWQRQENWVNIENYTNTLSIEKRDSVQTCNTLGRSARLYYLVDINTVLSIHRVCSLVYSVVSIDTKCWSLWTGSANPAHPTGRANILADFHVSRERFLVERAATLLAPLQVPIQRSVTGRWTREKKQHVP